MVNSKTTEGLAPSLRLGVVKENCPHLPTSLLASTPWKGGREGGRDGWRAKKSDIHFVLLSISAEPGWCVSSWVSLRELLIGPQ